MVWRRWCCLDGAPRRYYAFEKYEVLKPLLNYHFWISLGAFVLAAGSLVFIVNLVWTLIAGRKVSERNPWQATTLEWTTETPPPHGNWTTPVPEVHRWPYDYSVPGASEDFTPQPVAAAQTPVSS